MHNTETSPSFLNFGGANNGDDENDPFDFVRMRKRSLAVKRVIRHVKIILVSYRSTTFDKVLLEQNEFFFIQFYLDSTIEKIQNLRKKLPYDRSGGSCP